MSVRILNNEGISKLINKKRKIYVRKKLGEYLKDNKLSEKQKSIVDTYVKKISSQDLPDKTINKLNKDFIRDMNIEKINERYMRWLMISVKNYAKIKSKEIAIKNSTPPIGTLIGILVIILITMLGIFLPLYIIGSLIALILIYRRERNRKRLGLPLMTKGEIIKGVVLSWIYVGIDVNMIFTARRLKRKYGDQIMFIA
jgi:hypothetical protein